MNNEQCERLLIAEQVERAKREAREKGESTSAEGASEEGKRQEEGSQCEGKKKVVLLLSAKPAVTLPSERLKLNALSN